MTKKVFVLITIAILIKGFYFFGSHYVFTHQLAETNKTTGLYTLGKDIEDHFIPLENWWDEGIYYRTLTTGKTVYAARPPGYAPFYLPMYILTNHETARSLFTLFSFIIDIVGSMALFFLIFRFSNDKVLSFLGFLLYAFLPFITVYANFSKTEPISTAIILFGMISLIKGIDKGKIIWTLLSGILLSDAILIRPAIALFVFLFIGILFLFLNNWKQKIYHLLALGIPIFLIVGFWIYRSSVIENRFIPIVDKEAFGNPKVRALFHFISETNGDIQGWIPGSEASWFAKKGSTNYDENLTDTNPFDPSMFSGSFTFDSLLVLRRLAWQSSDSTDQKHHDSVFIKKAESLLALYKQERTLWHRIKTEVKIFLRFIFIKHAHGTFIQKSSFWYQVAKVYWLAWYYLVVLGGISGLILGILKKEKWIILLGGFCVFYMSVHANFLGLIENRYLAAIIPFFSTTAGYLIFQLDNSFFKSKLKSYFEPKLRP